MWACLKWRPLPTPIGPPAPADHDKRKHTAAGPARLRCALFRPAALYLFERQGDLHAKSSGVSPTQGAHAGTAAERCAYIRAQRAYIRALGAFYVQHKVTVFQRPGAVQASYVNLPRLALDLTARAGDVVELAAPDLYGAVHGRYLLNLPAEARQHGQYLVQPRHKAALARDIALCV